MTKEETLRTVHGLRMLLPPSWEDSSLYRFNAPPADAPKDGKPRLQPNALISRHEKRQGDTPDRFFELTNRDAKKANPSFEVARSGTFIYLDQIAHWQDTRFTDQRTAAPVFQRQLIVPTWPNHLTLVTLTGTETDLARMSGEMGLEGLGETPGGVRVSTPQGTVAGVLMSEPGGKKKR